MSGRGIVGGGVFRSELIEANARTSDPTNPRVGDWWIRSDVQPSVDGATTVGALRIQGTGGVLEVPFFDAAEESNLGADVYVGERFRFDDGAVGFIAETDQGGALGSPRVVTPTGAEYQAHDALELSAIPDSVVAQYNARKLTGIADGGAVTTRPNQAVIGTDNLTGSGTYRASGLNGKASVEYNGSSDSHSTNGQTINQKFVIYAVIDPDFANEDSGFETIFADGGGTDVNVEWNHSVGVWEYYAGGIATRGSSTIGRSLITVVFDGANSLLREDGTQTASGDAGSDTIVVGSIGYNPAHGRYFTGDISFVEIHDGNVSSGLQTREQEIADMWGITLI